MSNRNDVSPDREQRKPPDRRPGRGMGQGVIDRALRTFDSLGGAEVELGPVEAPTDRFLLGVAGAAFGMLIASLLGLISTLGMVALGGQGNGCCLCCKALFPVIGFTVGFVSAPRVQGLHIRGWRIGAGGFVLLLLLVGWVFNGIGSGVAQIGTYVREGTPIEQAREECRWVWNHHAPEDDDIPIPPQCEYFIEEFEAEAEGRPAPRPGFWLNFRRFNYYPGHVLGLLTCAPLRLLLLCGVGVLLYLLIRFGRRREEMKRKRPNR